MAKKKSFPQKACPNCKKEGIHARKKECPNCGYQFEKKPNAAAKATAGPIQDNGRPATKPNEVPSTITLIRKVRELVHAAGSARAAKELIDELTAPPF